jgi:hypothetical protein
MLVQEVNKKVRNVRPKEEVENMVKKFKKEYEKPVRGRFDFAEAKGGSFSFTDRPFPGMPIMIYTLTHDEVCLIPHGVAKRLNNTIQKVRKQNSQMNEAGPVKGVPASFENYSRVRFIPEEYL